MVARFKDPIQDCKAHISRAKEFDEDYWLVRQDRIHIDDTKHFEVVGADSMGNYIYGCYDQFCNYQDLRWLKFGDYLYPCAMNKDYLLPENWDDE